MSSDLCRTTQNAFVCTRCGTCCSVGGNMLVTELDISRIAAYLDCDPTDRCRIPYSPVADHPGLYRFDLTHPCFFQDKQTLECMIHDAKPQACKDYPFVLWSDGGCDFVDVSVCQSARRIMGAAVGVYGRD